MGFTCQSNSCVSCHEVIKQLSIAQEMSTFHKKAAQIKSMFHWGFGYLSSSKVKQAPYINTMIY